MLDNGAASPLRALLSAIVENERGIPYVRLAIRAMPRGDPQGARRIRARERRSI